MNSPAKSVQAERDALPDVCPVCGAKAGEASCCGKEANCPDPGVRWFYQTDLGQLVLA